jgi:hypothetical protein
MTLRPRTALRRGKGQPEGFAVTGITQKPGAEKEGLVSFDTAGQNNSSLTPKATSVVNGEWELILAMSSHYCFVTPPLYPYHVSP